MSITKKINEIGKNLQSAAKALSLAAVTTALTACATMQSPAQLDQISANQISANQIMNTHDLCAETFNYKACMYRYNTSEQDVAWAQEVLNQSRLDSLAQRLHDERQNGSQQPAQQEPVQEEPKLSAIEQFEEVTKSNSILLRDENTVVIPSGQAYCVPIIDGDTAGFHIESRITELGRPGKSQTIPNLKLNIHNGHFVRENEFGAAVFSIQNDPISQKSFCLAKSPESGITRAWEVQQSKTRGLVARGTEETVNVFRGFWDGIQTHIK